MKESAYGPLAVRPKTKEWQEECRKVMQDPRCREIVLRGIKLQIVRSDAVIKEVYMRSKCLETFAQKGHVKPPASSLLRIWRRQLEAIEGIEREILYEIAGEPQVIKILHGDGKGRDFLWELDRLWQERGSNPADPLIEKIRATREFLLARGYEADDLGTQWSLCAVQVPT